MSKKRISRSSRKYSALTTTLLARYFLSLFACVIGVLLLAFFSWIIWGTRIWYGDEPAYRLLKFFKNNIVLLGCILFVFCWVGVTYFFLSKPLVYLDEVTKAARQLTAPTNQPIVLPDPISQLERELNLLRENALENARIARDAEQRKNDLVVYLAHDLKTPLTSVIGYLTLLNDEKHISPELREKYLSISLDKAERLEDLINEFFEITRFNLSEIILEYSKVNLSRLLEQLTYEFQPMFSEKNLKCTLDIPADTMIRCDVNKMQRVFDNLLRNAVNYSFTGGNILIRGEQKGHYFLITFMNNGNTIPPEKLERIFEQFYRLDASRSSGTGGAGLGLAIAKEIVEHHHGTITAQSKDDTITFQVSLPIS